MRTLFARIALASCVLVIAATGARATEQASEIVTIDGVDRATYSIPLAGLEEAEPEAWRRLVARLPQARCSPAWRGYLGRWELAGDRLFLVELSAWDCQTRTAIPLALVFPGASGKVEARWFSGDVLFGREPMLPGPCGFALRCPSGYDVVTFVKGRVTQRGHRPRAPAGATGADQEERSRVIDERRDGPPR